MIPDPSDGVLLNPVAVVENLGREGDDPIFRWETPSMESRDRSLVARDGGLLPFLEEGPLLPDLLVGRLPVCLEREGGRGVSISVR